MPARKKDGKRLPWYDLLLSALVFGICLYFLANSYAIGHLGWVPAPSTFGLVVAGIIAVLALEAGRRMAGWPFTIICTIFGIYPLIAEHMPGILYGYSFPAEHIISTFAYGRQGMLGLPAQVAGEILIGFLIFAGVLLASGAGNFFLNLALALLGRYRGGPAKVAVLSSGFFGSLSGAPTVNVVSTGSITIPAMKRIGYPSYYAGAVEAVASTGGVIMPPVMGTIIFIMAILTDIAYTDIVIAALIPAVLYYWSLLMQVDAYAARQGLKGLPASELPPLGATLKEGWHFIAVIIFLMVGLIYFRWGSMAAVYSAGLLIVLSYFNKQTMMTPRKLVAAIATIGNMVTFIMAILLPIGLIIIGLMLTGTLTAITAKMVAIGGTSLIAVLFISVVVCYLFGMIGLAQVGYIILAVTAVPALIEITGLSPIAVHLFIIYLLIMGGITPPVAIVAFVAAAVANAPPMKTAFMSMRLAVVIYFVPFIFLFNPALILEGDIGETLILLGKCVFGITILAAGLEGYLLRVGRLEQWLRPPLAIGGFLFCLPGLITTITGCSLAVLVIIVHYVHRRKRLPVGNKKEIG